MLGLSKASRSPELILTVLAPRLLHLYLFVIPVGQIWFENKFGRNEEDMINTSCNELQWNNVPIATHELMAEVDADLGNVVVAGEDERSHEIVAAVAARLEARNLEHVH